MKFGKTTGVFYALNIENFDLFFLLKHFIECNTLVYEECKFLVPI